MNEVVNAIVSEPPKPGHQLTVARLGHTDSYDLADVYTYAGRVAAYLREGGIARGDRVGIVAANSLEWILLDLACLRIGALSAGFAVDQFPVGPDLVHRYDLSALYTDRPLPTDIGDAPIRPLSLVAEAAGDDERDTRLPEPVSYAPGDVTTLKFTSGSTGVPKGLGATVGSIDASISAVQQLFEHTNGDDLFVFLPLSLLQQRYWIYSAMYHGHDVTVSTYEAAFAALRTARPTVVMGVPAFFDTAQRHIQALAVRDGDTRGHAHRFFGGRIRYLWTGSAPANPAMLRFFTEAGLPIYEGYGLNETCIVSKNAPGAHREGSAGRVLPGKHVSFDESGSILVRSDYPVNTAYTYAMPGESERIFGSDGVVRTGDLGHLDEDGFLWIRGRADDVIVLTNGRNLVTRPIEERVKASPLVEECVLHYLGRSHLVAIVSPATARTPDFDTALAAHVAAVNTGLGQDEQIRRVIVADPPFTIGNGLLTSQYKPQRRRIAEAYQSELDDHQRGIHAS
jgi:long-chain acyl-CoA synthetase